jgi:hypothetical protein
LEPISYPFKREEYVFGLLNVLLDSTQLSGGRCIRTYRINSNNATIENLYDINEKASMQMSNFA